MSPSVDVEVYVIAPEAEAPDYDSAIRTFDRLNVPCVEDPDLIADAAALLITA